MNEDKKTNLFFDMKYKDDTSDQQTRANQHTTDLQQQFTRCDQQFRLPTEKKYQGRK